MKNYKYIALSLAVAFGLGSCSLDTEMYTKKVPEETYKSIKDVESGTIGVYYQLGYYPFLGNYATILGDMCAGIGAGSASSGHFNSYSTFTFSDTEQELEDIWNYGYKVIGSSATTINEAEKLMKNGSILEGDYPEAYNYIGQCYALKALAEYYLVNLYGLPYSSANASTPGIVVIDKDVPEAMQNVERGTVEQTYTQIKNDIAAAEEAFTNAGENAETSAYYLTPMGLQALKARVYLSLGDYATAEQAAKKAIELKGSGDGDEGDTNPSNETYLSMWGNVAVNAEDIFTIKKSNDDNLSANSLNTAYGSYYCTIQNVAQGKFGDRDVRKKLFIKNPGRSGQYFPKFYGESAAAVTNIPIFRKSEMSLIIAECEARTGSIAEAQNYLMYTAKRDEAITSAADLPSTKDELLSFISDERIREFFGEGHRFYDARRMGDKVSGDNFQDWDIQKFVFPIPAGEINSGFGVKQNENWSDNLPTLKKSN